MPSCPAFSARCWPCSIKLWTLTRPSGSWTTHWSAATLVSVLGPCLPKATSKVHWSGTRPVMRVIGFTGPGRWTVFWMVSKNIIQHNLYVVYLIHLLEIRYLLTNEQFGELMYNFWGIIYRAMQNMRESPATRNRHTSRECTAIITDQHHLVKFAT